jgi:hypothetical protein
MVYLAPDPSVGASCSPWGGWHITVAGGAPYAGDRRAAVADLGARVAAAARAAAADVRRAADVAWPWYMTAGNVRLAGTTVQVTRSSLLGSLLGQLRARGVRRLAEADQLHLALDGVHRGDAAAALGALRLGGEFGVPFRLFVVERPDGARRAGAWHAVDAAVAGRPPPPAASFSGRGSAVGRTSGATTGAGVVLLEMYRRKEARGLPARYGLAAILFREDGVYTDAGGKRDARVDARGVRVLDGVVETAQRELKEESCGLFRLDLRKARLARVGVSGDMYCAFFVPVRMPAAPTVGIRRDLFAHNRAVALAHRRDLARWLETDAMTRVYLDDLADALPGWARGQPLGVRDVYGADVRVSARAAAAVRNFLRAGCGGLTGLDWNTLRLDERCADRGLGRPGTATYGATKGKTAAYWM